MAIFNGYVSHYQKVCHFTAGPNRRGLQCQLQLLLLGAKKSDLQRNFRGLVTSDSLRHPLKTMFGPVGVYLWYTTCVDLFMYLLLFGVFCGLNLVHFDTMMATSPRCRKIM